MNIEEILKTDSNGNYILSKDELVEELKKQTQIVLEYHLLRYIDILDDKDKLEFIKEKKVERIYCVKKILESVKDFEYFKEIVKVINTNSYDIPKLVYKFTDSYDIPKLVYKFTDKEKEELISYINSSEKNMLF